jgi:hypothetical protein
MLRKYFLIVTALGEGGTGLLLLVLPDALLGLLLGIEQPAPETQAVARLAGAALVTLGIACWLGRSEAGSRAQLGVLVGVLFYNVAAAGVLAYAGTALGLASMLLWPAVVVHATLALWCAVCLVMRRPST